MYTFSGLLESENLRNELSSESVCPLLMGPVPPWGLHGPPAPAGGPVPAWPGGQPQHPLQPLQPDQAAGADCLLSLWGQGHRSVILNYFYLSLPCLQRKTYNLFENISLGCPYALCIVSSSKKYWKQNSFILLLVDKKSVCKKIFLTNQIMCRV